jgi:hypothetical protein
VTINKDVEEAMAEEIVELAGELIMGAAEAVVEIGAAAAGGSENSKRGCRVFLWFALAVLVIAAVAAYFIL